MTMSTIDHAAEALEHIHDANIAAGHGEYASSDLEVKTAQVHATLALVEQARIANLIAYVTHADGLAQGHKEWLEEEMGI